MEGGGQKRTVRVNVFHETYVLRTALDEAEAQEVANLVDELMNRIAANAPSLDASRVAVLACLHLAQQVRHLERELQQLKGEVARRSRDFAALLDGVMRPDQNEGTGSQL